MQAAAAPLQRECCTQLDQPSGHGAASFLWNLSVAFPIALTLSVQIVNYVGILQVAKIIFNLHFFMVNNPEPLFSTKNPRYPATYLAWKAD